MNESSLLLVRVQGEMLRIIKRRNFPFIYEWVISNIAAVNFEGENERKMRLARVEKRKKKERKTRN